MVRLVNVVHLAHPLSQFALIEDNLAKIRSSTTCPNSNSMVCKILVRHFNPIKSNVQNPPPWCARSCPPCSPPWPSTGATSPTQGYTPPPLCRSAEKNDLLNWCKINDFLPEQGWQRGRLAQGSQRACRGGCSRRGRRCSSPPPGLRSTGRGASGEVKVSLVKQMIMRK